jgi:hypothetical protein
MERTVSSLAVATVEARGRETEREGRRKRIELQGGGGERERRQYIPQCLNGGTKEF